MTRRQAQLPALILTLASCAGPVNPLPKNPGGRDNHPPESAPTQVKTDPAITPAYKKPVRMNGRGELSSISLEDFFALQQSGKVLIYDARPAFFYHLGHIPGAISLPKNRCDESIAARQSEIQAALADGHPIVVYCTSLTCPDARTLAIHLSGFGYPASVFSGGWEAWRQADMPGQ